MGMDFPKCPVCGSDYWECTYKGRIRNGNFGETIEGEVRECKGCGIERLNESLCLGYKAYESFEYRELLDQGHEIARHYEAHDELARYTLEVIWPHSLRGLVVADVGCGGGSLLDHIAGLPKDIIAIDPAEGFRSSLQDRGYLWYSSAKAACEQHSGAVDFAFAIQVIEHVEDPKTFLEEMRDLLKPGGLAVVSTPNRADILMELLPDEFPQFFYRTQHRWAFDKSSLIECGRQAGLALHEVRYVHRYGIANTMHWLKDAKPRGRKTLFPLDTTIDAHWRAWLEANGRSDNIYLVFKK